MQKSRLIGTVLALALSILVGFEGLRTKPYYDTVHVLTVCIGETQGIEKGRTYTEEECRHMLAMRLPEYEAAMIACLPEQRALAVPDKSWVAFLSVTYNIGGRAFCRSTMAKRIRAGDIRGACQAIMLWNKPPELMKVRRPAERKLCLEGLQT